MAEKVYVWYMTEEERLAYIEKNPIKPIKKDKVRRVNSPDYKWRGDKAAASRWNKN